MGTILFIIITIVAPIFTSLFYLRALPNIKFHLSEDSLIAETIRFFVCDALDQLDWWKVVVWLDCIWLVAALMQISYYEGQLNILLNL